MKIAGFKTLAIALFAAMAVTGAAAQQVTDGTFTPPSTSVGAGWGTNASLPSPGFGPNATVNWTSGGQYAYVPAPGDFGGWTFNGGAGVQQNGSAWGFTNAPNGLGQSAFIQDYNGSYCYNGGCVPVGTVGSPSSISQSLSSLTSGNSYVLSFYMEERSYNSGGYAPIVVSVGGSQSGKIAPASTDFWQLYTVDFTATSSSEALSFFSPFPPGLASGSDLDTGIADVAIVDTTTGGSAPADGIPIQVPEGSASWLYLLLAGAATFGAIFLSRREGLASRTEA